MTPRQTQHRTTEKSPPQILGPRQSVVSLYARTSAEIAFSNAWAGQIPNATHVRLRLREHVSRRLPALLGWELVPIGFLGGWCRSVLAHKSFIDDIYIYIDNTLLLFESS